jgi:hypothetical protein
VQVEQRRQKRHEGQSKSPWVRIMYFSLSSFIHSTQISGAGLASDGGHLPAHEHDPVACDATQEMSTVAEGTCKENCGERGVECNQLRQTERSIVIVM